MPATGGAVTATTLVVAVGRVVGEVVVNSDVVVGDEVINVDSFKTLPMSLQ
jgi:hypothetical protein